MQVGRTVGRYLAGLLTVAVVVAGGLVLRIVTVSDDEPHTVADAIVVMGAAQYNGTPSAVFAARLDRAAELFDQGSAPLVATVGAGRSGDAFTEAEAGRRYLAAQGLPEDALLAVPLGGDTLGSVRALADEMEDRGLSSVIIVSDPWHLARSRMMARDAGLVVQVSPVTTGPATADAVELRYIGRELLGMVYYRLFGGSSGAGTTVL